MTKFEAMNQIRLALGYEPIEQVEQMVPDVLTRALENLLEENIRNLCARDFWFSKQKITGTVFRGVLVVENVKKSTGGVFQQVQLFQSINNEGAMSFTDQFGRETEVTVTARMHLMWDALPEVAQSYVMYKTIAQKVDDAEKGTYTNMYLDSNQTLNMMQFELNKQRKGV